MTFCVRLGLALLAAAFFTCSAIPATATSISSTVSSPQVNTGTNQLVTTGIAGVTFAQALTDYGLNKAYALSNDPGTFMQAISTYTVDFTLSGNGLSAGTAVPLTVQYMYDAAVSTSAPTGNAAFSFRVGPDPQNPGGSFFSVRSNTYGGGFFDQCESRFPLGGDHPAGACAGSFSGSGFATDSFSVIGANRIESILVANAAAGVSDSFNTARILGIIVPDGVNWTYSPDITGNPLNFQHANAAAVPEPSAWSMIAVGAAMLVFFRRQIPIDPAS